jgi:short-subunit dehydrogenase
MTLALITGASSGLGEALARLLSAKGIPLILTSRHAERLQAVAESLNAEWIALDLTEDREPLIDLIRGRCPDLVINNAGFGYYGPALAHATAAQMKILEVNGCAALEISLESARALKFRKRPGVICNISSIAGEFPFPSLAVYAAAKAFITSFSKSFDTEMRPFDIRVLAAIPGQIATPFATHASKGNYEQHPSFSVLSPSYVAQQIWRQIEKRKGVQIIDWRYRFALLLAKALPRHFFEKQLSRRIMSRL